MSADQKYCSPEHRKLARNRRLARRDAGEPASRLVGAGVSRGQLGGGPTHPLPPRTAGPYRRLVPEPRPGPWQRFLRYRRLRRATGPEHVYLSSDRSLPSPRRVVRPLVPARAAPPRPPGAVTRAMARGGAAVGTLLARALVTLVLVPVGAASSAAASVIAHARARRAATYRPARTRTAAPPTAPPSRPPIGQPTAPPDFPPAAAPSARPHPVPSPRPAAAPTPSPDRAPTAKPAPAPDLEPATEPRPETERERRRARKELARREAAAVLAGALLPGEAPPPRRGRGRPSLLPLFETRTPGGRGPAAALPGLPGMPVSETLRSALEAVAKNGLRSVLTMVGIVIGVAAVIALVAMGNGMRTNFNAQFSRLANLITITSTSMGGPKYGTGKDLTERDVRAISDPRRNPDVVQVSPSVSDNVILTLGQAQSRSKMIGVQANYLDLMDRKIVAGEWFSGAQMAGNERVAVLGEDPVVLLWGRGARPEDVIGSRVRVKSTEFRVIGILKSDGQNDNVVVTPFGTARAYLVGGNDTSKIDQIVVRASSVAALDRASGQIVTALDNTHNIRDPGKRDYNVLTYTNLLNKTAQFIKNLTLFIVSIAAISLLVGGIGVANIMLVSVTERTREIGIRKAIGAKNRFILRQFLSEAVMLTGLGGVAGAALGIGATLIAARLLPPAGSTEATETNFPAPILTAQPVIVAFAVSLVIGILAGMYPAYRATRMRPVDALRFE